MDTQNILAALDEELARLQEAKRLLTGIGNDNDNDNDNGIGNGAKRRGRPPASSFEFGVNAPTTNTKTKPRKKHVMSAKAKDAIREAQRKRWAEWHKTHPKK